MTANYEYSRSNGEIVPLLIQLRLSKKQRRFAPILLHFWNLHQILKIFLKYEHHSLSISRIIDCEKRGYLNVDGLNVQCDNGCLIF